jgi:hypothetical protein
MVGFGLYAGEYVAVCARNECKYFGDWSPRLTMLCEADRDALFSLDGKDPLQGRCTHSSLSASRSVTTQHHID